MDDIKRPPKTARTNIDIQSRPTPQPVQRETTQPVRPADDEVAESSQTPEVTPVPSETQPTAPVDNPQTPELASLPFPERNRAPVAVIVIAIVVCIGLIGLTVFAFLKTNETETSNTDSNSSNQSQSEPATQEDVDSASQAVDQELETLNDDQDYTDTELSDQTLGL
jgi:uncharacterized protein HemX